MADFGLLTIISDPQYTATSGSSFSAGTIRWMSPELLHPDHFGFAKGKATKASDCYALGMVTLEVLTGRPPFSNDSEWIVMQKVVNCEHPGRPEGPWFTDDLWETLKQCWATQPKSRPRIRVMLEYFVQASRTWQPHTSPVDMGSGVEEDAGSDEEKGSDEGVESD